MTARLINPDALRDPGELPEVVDDNTTPVILVSAPDAAQRARDLLIASSAAHRADLDLYRAATIDDERESRIRLITAWAALHDAMQTIQRHLPSAGATL